MSYSVIKTWIPGEILTASDLNAGFSNDIAACNDLDSRVTVEVTAREVLEAEHDTLAGNVWDGANTCIAANKVKTLSILNDAVTTAKILDGNVTLGKLPAGVLTADATGRAKMADLFITNAKVNDVAVGKLTGTIVQSQLATASVGQSQLKTSTGSVSVAKTGITDNVWYIEPLKTALPGGEYGFYPRVRCIAGSASGSYAQVAAWIAGYTTTAGSGDLQQIDGADSGYQTRIGLILHHKTNNPGEAHYAYASQRYITSSGEIHWVFILRDKITKQIISMWQAPDHPCFGNGGKPEIVQHPFGSYDPTKHEIIIINPSNEEVEEIMAKCEIEDETKPDKDFLQIIAEEYEIDEALEASWPDKEVTVGLPKQVKDKEGKKHLVDYRFLPPDTEVKPIKKKIPKPDYILCRKLKKK